MKWFSFIRFPRYLTLLFKPVLMAFLQGVKGVLPSEHRPRPGSLGFIAQAEEQAGPPGRLPAGRGGIWASHAVPAALRVSAPLGPRPPLDGLRPRSNGTVSPRPLWASPLLGVAGPSGPPRSCRLVPHLLPFAPWPRPPEGALPRAHLCSVRLPLFSAGPGARSAGAFSPQPRTMLAAGLRGGLLALRSGRLLWSPGATRPVLPAPVKGERVSPAPRPQDW